MSLGEGENNKGLEMVEVEVVATSVRLRSIVCRCLEIGSGTFGYWTLEKQQW